MKETPNIDIWFICRNEDLTVIHYFFNPANNEMDTGQPIVEEYTNEADWLERLKELGITP
tara:strand:+ start:1057 stop:1236 length:180 start_codon:yes stop_codon:yes gene_type:complete